MHFFKIYYKLRDNLTKDEFIIHVYWKSTRNKFTDSEVPHAIRSAVYSLPNVEELVLHGWEMVSKEEYEKYEEQLSRK